MVFRGLESFQFKIKVSVRASFSGSYLFLVSVFRFLLSCLEICFFPPFHHVFVFALGTPHQFSSACLHSVVDAVVVEGVALESEAAVVAVVVAVAVVVVFGVAAAVVVAVDAAVVASVVAVLVFAVVVAVAVALVLFVVVIQG